MKRARKAKPLAVLCVSLAMAFLAALPARAVERPMAEPSSGPVEAARASGADRDAVRAALMQRVEEMRGALDGTYAMMDVVSNDLDFEGIDLLESVVVAFQSNGGTYNIIIIIDGMAYAWVGSSADRATDLFLSFVENYEPMRDQVLQGYDAYSFVYENLKSGTSLLVDDSTIASLREGLGLSPAEGNPPAAAPQVELDLSAGNGGPAEHWLWGLSSASTRDDVNAALQARGIQGEDWDDFVELAEGQSIVMFGLPVNLRFYLTASMPETLNLISIECDGGWTIKSADPQGDEVLRDTLDAYRTMGSATAEQYGGPTGGFMQTGRLEEGKKWSCPLTEGQLDYDTILSALEQERYVEVHTFHGNVDVVLTLSLLPAFPFGQVGITYYKLGDEFSPSNDELLTFEQPGGSYGAGGKEIILGF